MKEIISIKTDYNVLSSMIKLPDLFSYAVTNNIIKYIFISNTKVNFTQNGNGEKSNTRHRSTRR